MTTLNEDEARELFGNVEETLIADESGTNARRMIDFFKLCAARVRSVAADAPAEERTEASAVLSALDAASEIVEQVWANVHAKKALP
ncbi:MAG: hypothetical protein ING59_10515 [Burkholderiales bacterium]|jgi:hypothetical protein|nr:hypothetical protein [Burkholderiales bacterium]